jgi:hypothetical protein
MAACRRVLLAVILSLGSTAVVSAQDGMRQPSLTGAKVAYGLGAAADAGTTFYALHYGSQEQNPAVAWMQPKIGTAGMLVVGEAADLAAVALLTRWLGPTHPRLVRIGLYTAAGIRGTLAARNIRNGHQYRDVYGARR